MDRPVSIQIKRKILIKQLSIISIIAIVPLLVLIFLKSALIPVVNLSMVSTAVTEKGDIQITIQGSGIVVPAYEEIITSPFRSSVLKITKTPGAKVNTGDTLVLLSNILAENDLNMARNELDLKNIRIEKLKIELQQLREDFEFNRKIKEIRVENARLEYESEVQLNKMGGSPAYNVKKAKTEWEIAQLEFSQAQYNFNNQVNARNNGIRELETEINIQENRIVKAEDLVNKACVKAPFNGNLSWIVNQPGATISEGQEIARIADFSSYKLKGTISNAWAGKIAADQKVEIRDKDRRLSGTIENILPAINQGMMECQIRIDTGRTSLLRADQQLEIRVIVSFKENILRLPNGPFYENQGYKEMYIIRGNRAYRKRILLGDANFDYVEVVDGLTEGDRVILTDITEKYTRDEIKVKM